ncbi:MAG: alkaline phosphatase PhoX, partial [Actinomycetota bacterium]
MDDHDDQPTNQSGNRPFEEVLEARFDRRKALAGGLTAMAVTFVAPSIVGATTPDDDRDDDDDDRDDDDDDEAESRRRRNRVRFEPVAVADGSGPTPAISSDYEYQIIIPWGEPIVAPYPEHVNGQKTAEDQEKQIGIGHDGMHFFPLRYRNDRGVLCINHEFGRN